MANVDGFSRIQSEQAKQQVDAALVTAVNDAIVAQAFKSAVQEREKEREREKEGERKRPNSKMGRLGHPLPTRIGSADKP